VTDTRSTQSDAALIVAAAAVLVSGGVHFYLYFRGGYRNIMPEEFAGLTISRSFALNAIVAVGIAELLVLALRFRRSPARVQSAPPSLGARPWSRTRSLARPGSFQPTMNQGGRHRNCSFGTMRH